MISIARQTLEHFLKTWQKLDISKLINIQNSELFINKWALFVTLYKNWNIRWSYWNILAIESNKASEIIENTFLVINDKRFPQLEIWDLKNISIRIDEILSRNILQDTEILKKDPLKKWIIAIKKDYKKMTIILPNISSILMTWEDFIPVLSNKLGEKFVEKNYYIYEFETKETSDY